MFCLFFVFFVVIIFMLQFYKWIKQFTNVCKRVDVCIHNCMECVWGGGGGGEERGGGDGEYILLAV